MMLDAVDSRDLRPGCLQGLACRLRVGLVDAQKYPAVGAEVARDGDQLTAGPGPAHKLLGSQGVAGGIDEDDGILPEISGLAPATVLKYNRVLIWRSTQDRFCLLSGSICGKIHF